MLHPSFLRIGNGLNQKVLSGKQILEADKIEKINNQKAEYKEVFRRSALLKYHHKKRKIQLWNNLKN